MSARDVTNGVGHRKYGQTKRQRDTNEADSEKRTFKIGAELRSQHSTPATAEYEPKRSDRFRDEFFTHVHRAPPWGVKSRRTSTTEKTVGGGALAVVDGQIFFE